MPGILNVLLARGGVHVATGIDINDSDTALSPGVAQATNQISAAGRVLEGGVDVGALLLVGDIANVDIFVATVSGVVDTGVVDSWVQLGAGAVTWTRVRNPPIGTNQFIGTYKLRNRTTGVEFFTGGTFALTAEVDI